MASPLIDSADRVSEVADAIRAAGRVALDLEFVSEGRYVPDLSLVQVGWGDTAAPEVAALDPLACDVGPVLALVADPSIEVVAHAARQDLGLLAARYGIVASTLLDTQLACAFAGLAEQLGYGRMIAELCGVSLDKKAQFTDWSRRPLSAGQLRYALDDVRYLPRAWATLSARLDERGRLGWLREESDRLARIASQPRDPDQMYRSIGGAAGLKGGQLGALQALAAWRERQAMASNTPPSWLAPDPVLLEMARRRPGSERELGKIRGLPAPVREAHGSALLAAVAAGAAAVPASAAPRALSATGQAWSQIITALVTSLGVEADLPPRMVASRADADDLVAWFEAGGDGEDGVEMLRGWRREVAGLAALSWLRGESTLAADRNAAGGLRVASPVGATEA